MRRAVFAVTPCVFIVLTFSLLTGSAGCAPPGPRAEAPTAPGDAPVDRGADGPRVRPVNLNVPTAPLSQQAQIDLSAAKSEVVSFAVQVTQLPGSSARRGFTLRLSSLSPAGGGGASPTAPIDATAFTAYQILAMPIDVNRAGFVRHTGLPGDRASLPRALLPVALDGGSVNLATARDPRKPTDPQGRGEGSGQPLLYWFDIRIPPETPPGEYRGSVDVFDSGRDGAVSTVPVRLVVHNFVLPDERHLMMVGQVAWDDLARLMPERFEAVRPVRLSRTDPTFTRSIQTLDQLIGLAQQHRLGLEIERLQPVVKWPAGKPPEVVWKDYDALVAPWLTGAAFSDKVGLGYWPLPVPDYLHTYDAQSRGEYLSQAAAHFDQLDWMTRSAIQIGEGRGAARASAEQSLRYSAEAQQVLSLHPRMRVMVPLMEDQLQLAGEGREMMLAEENVARLLAAAPPLVFSSPLQRLPEGVARPSLWLRADLSDAASSGLTPYVGAGGDEYDVRVWAWLAFLRNATLIQWGGVLPRASLPTQSADPNELVWFYPGSWFGVDEPLPTIQLKWLRNAQQDYEYLWLARQRGQTINAFLMARLITKPVEIQPNQPQDPTYALMCGTANPAVWREARQLLVDNILLRDPGAPAGAGDQRGEVAVNLAMLRWAQPQEQPVLMGRTTAWARDTLAAPGSQWINLRLGIDLYNASDSRPDQNELQWTAAYPGFEFSPRPISIPSLATYNVRRVTLEARVDPTAAPVGRQQPLEFLFTNGFTREQTALRLRVPAGVSDRRDAPIRIDGSLEDWSGEDAIHEGPLVQLFNRPALQAGVLQDATTPSSVYTTWADDRLYVAFRVEGAQQTPQSRSRNFVTYQFRRAWGEDLCQVLVQPVYTDGTLGPVLHVVCKSNGSVWVERKVDERSAVEPWQPFEGADIRYQASFVDAQWRGELSIPWNAILDADRTVDAQGRRQHPAMLRFNFAQHKAATGETATWAGPVDFGRDDAFTGIILLRDPAPPGMPGSAR
mgnify:CR=1 FL=1